MFSQKKPIKKLSPLLLVGALAFFSTGCANNARTGALIGSGVGAVAGAVIGNQSDEAGAGAAIGTAVGAGTGYVVGNEMDKQQRDSQDSRRAGHDRER
jgi:uncharacterized protein YcfJ